MKKVINWLLNAAMIMIVTVTLAPVVLGVLFFIFLFVAIKTDALDGLSRSEAAIAALEATRLSSYTEHAPYHCTTVDDCMTIFEIAEYDNHVDNTDLHADLMSCAAETDGWHVEPVTVADYAAHIPAEAAFLLPDVTFDAHHQADNSLSFFDQDSGLMVYLRTDRQPHAGTVRADKLTIPHNGFVYELETHGGFLGDGTTYRAFIVPEAERASLEATLTAHANWHAGAITRAEYIHLHNHEFYSVPGLYPADDVTFEWCSFVDTYARAHPDFVSEYTPDNSAFPAVMQQAGARPAGNWLLALYDADTGLFIYYEYDS